MLNTLNAYQSASEIGGKAYNLQRLRELGATVPPWIVLPTSLFDLTPQRCAEIRAMLQEAGLGSALLAVRSSAVGEDGSAASFAGQFDTVLGVQADSPELWDAIRQVWASAGSAHARAYSGGEPVRMAVILQQMVDPVVAGVAFSVDPVTGDAATAVVSAVYGLGEGLVSGELDADSYHVTGSAVRSTLAHKDRAVRLAPLGRTRIEPVPVDQQDAAALSDREARDIAEQARALEGALGAPQDVEWALVDEEDSDRRLYVLQTRPITTLPPTGERRVWDNSNIVESYAGVTSPLTFSFARSVYEQVYRQFCGLMGVDEALIDRNRHVFANMLGLIRGRVYYNLLNWYRALALLPGFSVNRAFMERMMGVRQKLENPPHAPAAAGRLQDAGRLLRMLGRMTREHRRLEREVPAFHAHVNAVLAPLAEQELATQSPDALVVLYRRLEDQLLRQWQTPLVNDFFAMIWFGVLGRLMESWLPGEPPALVNDLLAGEGGIVSTEPARRVAELAHRVRQTPALLAAFDIQPDDAALWSQLDGVFAADVRAYLEEWGDRCANELKLETITLRDDPAALLGTIRSYVAAGVEPPDPAREQEIRLAAERVVRRLLRGPRRAVFFRVLAQTRRRVRDRENLRFERTRVFAVVRRIMVALGAQLARAGRLDAPRDIFYLTVEEVFGFIDGTATTGNLRGLVALRRAEWDGYMRASAPPERFTSIGPPELGRWEVTDIAGAQPDGEALQGLGCCPGIVRAPVRVVRDPREAGDLSGRILVAERTDPGWTLLFPAASGLLVQRGSLLSHSAIVAREVGLACIVAIPGLLETLRDGETVEMDGTTGRVRRIAPG
ncbi:MAG: PEP-utilizing enzyme [Gemmatimonadota bacterium]|nr:PEP-utilizing enzyme [Gemmatimonadota bacterium]